MIFRRKLLSCLNFTFNAYFYFDAFPSLLITYGHSTFPEKRNNINGEQIEFMDQLINY